MRTYFSTFLYICVIMRFDSIMRVIHQNSLNPKTNIYVNSTRPI